MKKLSTITISIITILTLSAFTYDLQMDTLTLTSIDNAGYHFQSTTDDTGAFIDLSEANKYQVSNLSIGDKVTMEFNDQDDIVKVNDNIID